MNRVWTPEAVDTLAAMWQAGKSAGEIAAVLNRTRNMILGKAHRLGLHMLYPHPNRPKHEPSRKRSKPTISSLPSPPPVARSIALNHGDNAIRMRLRNGRKPVTTSSRTKHPEPPTSPSAVVPVDLWGLTGCKWPVNDGGPFLFCNAEQVEDSSYCEFHKTLATNPLRRVA